jgi:hypothetical protein
MIPTLLYASTQTALGIAIVSLIVLITIPLPAQLFV